MAQYETRHTDRTLSAGAMTFSGDDLEDFARGAAFLGAGGGGDPYIGRLRAEAAIAEFGQPKIIGVDALADDALVAMVAMLGAPTVLVEKGIAGEDIDLAATRLAERIGRPIDALIPAEIGGVNSTLPIVAAARLGLPLVNADGMGRAFPGIHMTVMNFEGVSATPFVVVDEHLNTCIIETDDAQKAEEFVRSVAVQMGMSCVCSGYAMTGAEVKRATVANTMTAALELGRAIVDGRRTGDPAQAIVDYLRSSPIYGEARSLFRGKIVDLQRETTRGFSIGSCTLAAFDDDTVRMDIKFQNEHLIATQGETVRAVAPDLISLVDAENAEPVPVEAMRYGQRVDVIAVLAPRALRTPAALDAVSPRCFGLDHDYTPLDALPASTNF
ncbi:MAG: DUF917 domain-containing protein [Pseudomonadota bacterium]